ncbi:MULTISPECIES: alcohol dehydrogenase catalytic domain-containing protein [Actinotignum]|uniref:alcohol dehydrogenase catalytic domain-containing protein n=1 Tax=Actinotignum TaxID=1653174 RepID=UPI0013E050B5|nr:alcohol dehydrogenase catalytic domain-containing protein [Actinotignum sanguinis]MDY5148739.1 alcohol dehydrogenase catalytic domain-containing protein [Actinotignum sanguinis]
MKLVEIPDLSLEAPTDALIDITATTVCGSDTHIVAGHMGVDTDFIIGHEYVGVVREVGEAVTNIRPGDRVFGVPAVSHFPLRTKCNSKYIKFSKSCTGVAFCGTHRHGVAFCGTHRHSVSFYKTSGREDAFSGLREGTRGDHKQSGIGATTNTRFSVVQYHSVRTDVLQYHYANHTHPRHRHTDMPHPTARQSTSAIHIRNPLPQSASRARRAGSPQRRGEVLFLRCTSNVRQMKYSSENTSCLAGSESAI